MTNQTNEQDLVFKARFEDDASADLKNLDGDVQDLNSSMAGLSAIAVTAGLAMFGVGVGVQQVLQGAAESHKRLEVTTRLIRLLPEAAQEGLSELEPFYAEIGRTVAATNLEVEETALAITRASGGIVPSLDQIQFAFDLAASTGTDLATAANIVGQSLQGNEEPLNALLDPSGKSYISLEKAMQELGSTAEAVKTPLDDMTKAFREQNEVLATTDGQVKTLLDTLVPMAGILLEATGLWEDFWDASAKPPDVGEAGQINDPLTQELINQGAFGVAAAGAGAALLGLRPVSVGITINGDVDSAQRVAAIMRQVELQIRNLYRGGINTIVNTQMFPN